MKLYIRSDEELDEKGSNLVKYYNFLLDHQSDLNNYLKKKIQQYFGTSPYEYEVEIEGPERYSYMDIYLGIYAKVDVVDAELTSDCLQHVVYEKGQSSDLQKLGYDNGKFYAILYDYCYPRYPNDNRDPLDYAYKWIDDACLRDYKDSKSFLRNLDDTINSVQKLYDEFKDDDVDLEFTITDAADAYVRMYQKNTGYILYQSYLDYSGVENSMSEAIDTFVYSQDTYTGVYGFVTITYDPKTVKLNKQLKPDMEKIAVKLQRSWDCIINVHKNRNYRMRFDITCRNQEEFDKIVNYIEDNLSQYDVSFIVELSGAVKTDYFTRLFGE